MSSSYEKLLTAMLLDPPDPNEPLPLANRKATLYGSTITFLITSWMAVTFRLWVRFRVVREPGWDDAFVFLAAVSNTAATICVCLSVENGLGQHMLYIGPSHVSRYELLFYLENALYVTECALIKISLLLQFLRIFKAGIMRWICIGLLTVVSLWGLAFFFIAWFPCFPVRGQWDRTIDANCYGFGLRDVSSFMATFLAQGVTNMALDIAVFMTPLVLFRTPNLKLRSALTMASVFAFGGLVVASSIYRVVRIVVTHAGTYPYIDFTWWTPSMIIICCLEIDLAIICASIPIFWPIIEKSLSAILVSHEVVITEERVENYGLAYELEHMKDGAGSTKSGVSTHELMNEEEPSGWEAKKEYTVGVDPFSDEVVAPIGTVKTDIKSKPKPQWEI